MEETEEPKRQGKRRWRARPESLWWLASVVVLPVLLITGLTIVVLVWALDPASVGERTDLVKTALSVGAGTGGVVALVLASRRQWSTEQAHRLSERTSQITEHDATERRITELYTKAAEQLGSDKHVVRLAGLYALERLAQNNPEHRQTIVNLLCGYLRTPYTPPPETGDRTGSANVERPLVTNKNQRKRLARPHGRDTAPKNPSRREAELERDVRLAAQRILAAHLRPTYDSDGIPTNKSFWPEVLTLDLTRATLIEIDLRACHIPFANFDWSIFTGHATFERTTFTDDVSFVGATFDCETRFSGTVFEGFTLFPCATFSRFAIFMGATFREMAIFNTATFNGDTAFITTTFNEVADFEDTIFKGHTRFVGTTFVTRPDFEDAAFENSPSFEKATLGGEPYTPAIAREAEEAKGEQEQRESGE
ncbi:pentapeptide repeat-containing protein [Streptoalloteichus tenebrarius]|uniref:pentapeptide repeat-containing protein n=1 Tax=Streptoalloteichus tenebrarius (strain ATCC 17920 / DSM 40477 / JCM 4838 / CBS 697.72 / NBRC 16177 / NCIMB 11028 / NRRL B-12390 / A12253. 1 / ISP 5477) TaxID=1933 RepID=UPI0020A39BC0|nr:hypothetical protein [Streptoalloteichus tenebrarius]